MRIALLIPSLMGGGAERMAAKLANLWAARGDAVTLISLDLAGDPLHQLNSNVRVMRLNVGSASRGLVSAILGNWKRGRAIRRALKSADPDIAVAMMEGLSVLLALSRFGLRCRAIGSERIYPPLHPVPRIWQILRRVSYRFLDAVTAQTELAGDWIRAHTSAHKVVVIPNPVAWPLADEAPSLSPALVRDNRLLLAVGRLSAQKGFADLIKAFAQVAPSRPDWSLVILGEGELRDKLQAQIETLGLTQRVLLPGRAGNMTDWYGRADIFALSSQYEGFPNVLVEAMAGGTAVISVNCPAGPADIIRDGVDGLLVAPDTQALAAGLARLMDAPALRQAMAAKAPEVIARFSEARVLDQWDALFSQVRR